MPMREKTSILMILGSGRSGTTWAAKLFDSHPDVLYRHEPDSVLKHHAVPFQPKLADNPQHSAEAKRYVEKLITVRTPKTTMRPPHFHKSFRTGHNHTAQRMFGYCAAAFERIGMPPALTPSIPDFYDRDRQPRHVVMKSVSSLNRMALFAEAMPGIRMLHIIRHPAGVIASRLRGMSRGKLKVASYLKSAFALTEPGDYPYSFDDFANRPIADQLAFSWMVFNDSAAQFMNNNPSYRAVTYEDLCTHLDSILRSLFEFADIAWHPQTEQFLADLSRTDTDNDRTFDVMRPPTSAINKWRSTLSSDQIGAIQEITKHARSEPVRRAAKFDDR